MSGTIPDGTISRAKPDNPGLDYAALRTEGIALVQDMSAQIWTDYNYSDPGVTILEQLCYALTELSYRAEFPVADLLGAPQTGRVAPVRQGLYPARAIMPINPVTADDLRRLVVDRVRHVGNAWFSRTGADGVAGLYRIDVLVPALDPDCCDDSSPNPDLVLRRVLDCYVAHRGLCEDVQAARVLLPLATRVAAAVQIGDHADPNAVMADLLFRLGLRLSPEPKRAPLDALIAAGRTTSEIFTGPLMLRGFIADDQLTALPDTIPVDDLLEIMAETPDVLSVSGLRVRVMPDPVWHQEGETIALPDATIARLAADGHEIVLLRGDAVCPTQSARVRRRLDRHWADQRQTYDLWSAYLAEYAAPVGAVFDLAAYSSVQDQFPVVYGIGGAGLPAGAGPARRAAARQLKGYLMAFDQVMADFFSQLAFVRSLFAPSAGGAQTYAFQSLRPIVPDVQPLLLPGYEAGLAALIAATDPVAARQADILELLLSLYAQTLAPEMAVDAAALVKARQALLTRVVPASRDRGRGFDYRHGGPRRELAGMEIRARIELALLDSAMHRDRHRQPAEPGAAQAGFARRLEHDLHEAVARGFMGVDFAGFEAGEDAASPLAGQRVAAELQAALVDAARYRMGKLPSHDGVVLVCQDLEGGWWVLGCYPGPAEATAAAHHVWWSAGGERLRLTIVEWTLLRDALPLLGCDGSAFSFRISAVLAAGWETEAESGWRSHVWSILRENTPAHIVLDTLFLGRRRMRVFERLHRDWVAALRHGSAERKAVTSLALVAFLREAAEPGPAVAVPAAVPVASVPAAAGAAMAPADVAIPEAPASAPPVSEPAAAEAPIVAAPVSDAPAPAAPVSPAAVSPALQTGSDDATRLPRSASFIGRLRARRTGTAPETSLLLPPVAPMPGLPATEQPPALPAPGRPVPALPPPAPPGRRHWWQRRTKPPAAEPAEPPASTPLALTVRSAPPGVPGFDTATALTPANAAAFADQGFRFAIRYVSRTMPAAAGDLSVTEVEGILRAGLALMAVQHCEPEGWTPSAALGTECGTAAAANAAAAGLPHGMNLWLDLEGCADGTAASVVVAYCNAWYDVVAAAGYLPGLYVGTGQVLTSEQLYYNLKFQHYWKSGSRYVPDVAVRGYCLEQTIDNTFVVDGISYDADVTMTDGGGNAAMWVVMQG